MPVILFKNIKSIIQAYESSPEVKKGAEMSRLATMDNAWMVIQDELIHSFGSMETWNTVLKKFPDAEVIDVTGRFVLPAFCDSHTHIVYAGSRENEFVYKIKGMSYEDIAKQGGGIINSAKRLQQTSEEELYENAQRRIHEMMKMGTGAVEIKSGYGLTTTDEIKMLRVIKRLKESAQISIKSTFLGAHAMPVEYKENRQGYINEITQNMLPQIAAEGLADYCDVFCDKGFFYR